MLQAVSPKERLDRVGVFPVAKKRREAKRLKQLAEEAEADGQQRDLFSFMNKKLFKRDQRLDALGDSTKRVRLGAPKAKPGFYQPGSKTKRPAAQESERKKNSRCLPVAYCGLGGARWWANATWRVALCAGVRGRSYFTSGMRSENSSCTENVCWNASNATRVGLGWVCSCVALSVGADAYVCLGHQCRIPQWLHR